MFVPYVQPYTAPPPVMTGDPAQDSANKSLYEQQASLFIQQQYMSYNLELSTAKSILSLYSRF
jgi:hypothetical protein